MSQETNAIDEIAEKFKVLQLEAMALGFTTVVSIGEYAIGQLVETAKFSYCGGHTMSLGLASRLLDHVKDAWNTEKNP